MSAQRRLARDGIALANRITSFGMMPNDLFTVAHMLKRLANELELTVSALEDLQKHHQAINASIGRMAEHSTTLRIVRRGLGEEEEA